MPAGVCGAIVFALRRLSPSREIGGGAALLAVGCAYLAAQLGIHGPPRLPPVDSTQALVFVVLFAIVLGSLGLRAGAGLAQRMATRAISVALLLWLTLRPVVRYQWEPVEAVLWLGSLWALLLLLWEGCARVASGLDSSSSLLGWITAVAGTGVVLGLSGTALFAQLSFALVSALLVLLAFSGSADATPRLVALPVLVVLLAAFLLNGAYYAELTALRALALAISPLGSAVALAAGRERGKRRLLSAVLAVTGVLLILTPVLVLATIEWRAVGDDYYDY